MQPNACAIRKVKDDMAKGAEGNGSLERPRDGLPPEILDVIWPALQVGGLSGVFSPYGIPSFPSQSLGFISRDHTLFWHAEG